MYYNIVDAIKDKIETPLYIFDLDVLKQRALYIKNKLPFVSLCFAMKANPFLVKPLEDLADKFEVCSPGEFNICNEADIDLKKLVISGVYKKEEDTKEMILKFREIGRYTVESMQQYNQLCELSAHFDKKISVLLRLSSGNQFGMDKSEIISIIENREKNKNVEISGIQYYSGTQKFLFKKIEREIERIDSFISDLYENYGFIAEELEYGPGLPVEYFSSSDSFDEEKYIDDFAELLKKLKFKGHITLEIGRFLAASCGYYLTKIVDKKSTGSQNYCITDGGIHHIRYFGQTMAMETPFVHHSKTAASGDTASYNICGSLCTVNDILVKQLTLDNPKIGDILVFENSGAYSVTEGISLFLSRALPAVSLYTEKNGLEFVRKANEIYKLNSKN